MHQTIPSTPRDVHWDVPEVSNFLIDWLVHVYRSDAMPLDAFSLIFDVFLALLAARKRADDFAVLAAAWACLKLSETVMTFVSSSVYSKVPDLVSYLGAATAL
jgi:hypothetical protein